MIITQNGGSFCKLYMRLWDIKIIQDIMLACVIMNNMIIEHEVDSKLEDLFEHGP
jgi:hypothetical protein